MNKKISIFYILFLFLIIPSCGKDDGPITNHPPGNFILLEVLNNSTGIVLNPQLSWKNAVDPEGDKVTYEVLLDPGTAIPSTTIAKNLELTNFAIDIPLDYNTVYSWQVIATDIKGNQTKSDIFTFTTREIKAITVNENAPFAERGNHSLVNFQNRMWIIDGQELADVWSSPDGINWKEETRNAGFPNRFAHTSEVFKGKIWIIGGIGNNIKYNDVWSSVDGVNWIQESANAGFSGRIDHTTVVFNDKIWVIGGSTGDFEANDVWSSSDGVNWIQITNNAPFLPRAGHTSVVFKNRIWVIGGINSQQGSGVGDLNDVWSSADGVNWIQEIPEAGFSKRNGHSSTVYKDKIWVIGGKLYNAFNDVWSSTNGKDWKKEANDVGFPGRMYHTSIAFQNKIWIISGWSEGNNKNDVYYLE